MFMDNNQIPQMPQVPPVQPMQPMQPVQPVQPMSPTQPMQPAQSVSPMDQVPQAQPTQPMQSAVPTDPKMRQAEAQAMLLERKNKITSLIKTIAIVILFLTTATFIGLFIWMNNQYVDASTDVEGQIAVAVAEAKHEQEAKDLAQFAEDEKYPLRSFAGPADYGLLSFEYPKTWSVYVAQDAAKGGDYLAYLNPLIIEPISVLNVNALRVNIVNRTTEEVVAEYNKSVEGGTMNVESVTVAGYAAVRYTGIIPGTELEGVVVIFKIRDKTAILRTDAMIFVNDFNALLSTVQFNA